MKKILFVYFIFLGGTIKAAEIQTEEYSKINKKRSDPKKNPYTTSNKEKVEKLIAKEIRKKQNRESARRLRLKKKKLIISLEASVYNLTKETARQASTINKQMDKLADYDKTLKNQETQLQKLHILCSQLQQEKNLLAQQIISFQAQQTYTDSFFAQDQSSVHVYSEAASAIIDGSIVGYQLQSSCAQL